MKQLSTNILLTVSSLRATIAWLVYAHSIIMIIDVSIAAVRMVSCLPLYCHLAFRKRMHAGIKPMIQMKGFTALTYAMIAVD